MNNKLTNIKHLRMAAERLRELIAQVAATAAAAIEEMGETKSDKGHRHTKSEITDFPASLPASDVPAWAKAASKPSYTASEVGARPDTWMPTAADVGAAASSHTHVSAVPITIPKTGWSSDSTATYPKYYDIAVTGVTARDRVSVDIAPSSMSTAVACGLCPAPETLAGKIRLRAASVPTASMTANYWIEKGA